MYSNVLCTKLVYTAQSTVMVSEKVTFWSDFALFERGTVSICGEQLEEVHSITLAGLVQWRRIVDTWY